MGVPAFYRWISEKYAKIVEEVLEKRPTVIDGTVIPMDLNEPNPNGQEFDNLYLDMNGLIHPCSHPEDREAPSTEEEMYINVTKYVDRLVAAIRPRRILYLAIDGVAPRAKMNQQRSRRFRTAQEMKEKKEMKAQVLQEMVEMGFQVPDQSEGSGGEWDSNVITPGTEFMCKLSIYLRFYILDKMNRDPFWRNLQVIISDASEPGEGEHKIMEFIRTQRAQAGYDPNTRHVLHGLDADLIMLALATHEPHFTILREKVFFGRKERDAPQVSDAQRLLNAQSMRDGVLVSCVHPEDEWIYAKPLQALHINILREYLDFEFSCLRSALPFAYDLERIIDDFIFLCFFVGNDFLPHLPSLDIRDGALDFLIECYKEVLPSLGNYITSPGGYINLFQADVILSKVGEIEDQIFLRKKHAEDENERRMERRNSRREGGGGYANPHYNNPNQQNAAGRGGLSQGGAASAPALVAPAAGPVVHDHTANASAAARLREQMASKRSSTTAGLDEGLSQPPSQKMAKVDPDVAVDEQQDKEQDADKAANEREGWDSEEEEALEEEVLAPVLGAAKPRKSLSAEDIAKAKEELKVRLKAKEDALFNKYKETVKDDVKLHETGWKARYYNEKHKRENIEQGGGLKNMCIAYVQGLCWVLQYYYQGVPSWNWYYPFHYAPFASDLVNIDTYGDIAKFEKSKPFSPLEQLLAVLPANSAKALPEEVRWLMLDRSSPIIDLYNDDVPIDPNGKHLPWLWILLLPFIDESRIVEAFNVCRPKLSLEARKRNARGGSVVFVHQSHPIAQLLRQDPSAQAVLSGCAAETDPEVLACIEAQRKELLGDSLDANREDSASTAVVENISAQQEITFLEGYPLAGTISRPPMKWYAHAQATIPAPDNGRWFFDSIGANQVHVFQFQHPSMDVLHQSILLDGLRVPSSKLQSGDLVGKRPPRLNRSGFNMLDMLNERRQGQGHGHGQGYNHHQRTTNPNNIYNLQQQHMAQGYQGYQQGYQGYQQQRQPPAVGTYFQSYPQSSNYNNYNYNQPAPTGSGYQGRGGDYQHRVEPLRDSKRLAAAQFSERQYNLFQQPRTGTMAVRGGVEDGRGRTILVETSSVQIAPQPLGRNRGVSAAGTAPAVASMDAMRQQLFQTMQAGNRMPPSSSNAGHDQDRYPNSGRDYPQSYPSAGSNQRPYNGQQSGHSFNPRHRGNNDHYNYRR